MTTELDAAILYNTIIVYPGAVQGKRSSLHCDTAINGKSTAFCYYISFYEHKTSLMINHNIVKTNQLHGYSHKMFRPTVTDVYSEYAIQTRPYLAMTQYR